MNIGMKEYRHCIFPGPHGWIGLVGSDDGIFRLSMKPTPEEVLEDLALAAIDAGADDVKTEAPAMEVHAPPDKLEAVREELQAEDVVILSAELEMVAKTPMPIDAGAAKQTLRLIDSLEDLDDVQKVYTNADFPDEVFAGMDD